MFRNILRIAVMFAVLFLGAQVVLASEGITLDPTIIRLTMRPGEVWRGQVSVTNTSDHAVTLAQTTANVSRTAEGDIVEVSEDIVARLGTLASWLVPDAASIVQAPGEKSLLAFSIRVPENAPPGTHRALLILTPSSTRQQSNALTTTAGVGLGIDLEIVGQTNHRISLEDVAVSPRVGTKPPVLVTGTVINAGNTLPVVVMRAQIGRLWGSGTRLELSPDNGSQKVAPGTQTLFRGEWDGGSFIPAGVFKVRVIAEDSSGEYEATRYFILVPWQLLVGLIVAAIVVYVGRKFGPRFVRRSR